MPPIEKNSGPNLKQKPVIRIVKKAKAALKAKDFR
jgi:hypothetical protein